MRQGGVTIVTEIIPEQEAPLRDLLDSIGNDIPDNPHIDFYALKTVHFMRWVVLEAAEVRGEPTPPQLILSTNFDGSLDAHLKEVVAVAEAGLDVIYAHCINAPKPGDRAAMLKFLKKHVVTTDALYIGAPGISVDQVRKEEALVHEIQDYLQTSNPAQYWGDDHPVEIREAILRHIAGKPEFQWALEPYHLPFLKKYGVALVVGTLLTSLAGFVILAIFLPLVALIVGAPVVLGLAAWAFFLRRREIIDAKNFRPLMKDPDKVASLFHRENHTVQNQISHLVTIRKEPVRHFTLNMVFASVRLLVKAVFNNGSLAGIRSIHFARWARLDGGKRLLFFSNYDGSWESYLGEFVDRGSNGLGLVWSNTEDYPPTRWLIREGARHADEFKAWSRVHQVHTQVWYSAYIHTSLKNINNNNAIRQGITGKMNAQQAANWLRRL